MNGYRIGQVEVLIYRNALLMVKNKTRLNPGLCKKVKIYEPSKLSGSIYPGLKGLVGTIKT